MIAEIARIVSGMTGKKILVLQPNKELLIQNVNKFEMTGEPCSIFSSSARSKSLKYPVVYGTALTVKNYLGYFCDQFCLVILDEADASLTPSIMKIIDDLRLKNKNLRVIGLTSSPYKLGSGYIYKLDLDGNPVDEDKALKPFFTKKIAHISGRELLSKGFISPVTVGSVGDGYDTDKLIVNSMGKFTSESLDAAFVGHGRKTAGIIGEIIDKSRDRKSVLIFAATQQHAEECMASLPRHLSAIVTDKTANDERARIVKDFTNQKIKYLVNVAIFTRGTDFPSLDVIAILRATESSALLHQIIGRAVRIAPGKKDALLLDYAGNLDRHHPDGDLFSPSITAWAGSKSEDRIDVTCPKCSTKNSFLLRDNENGYDIDNEGYYVDLMGKRIGTEFGDLTAHYGRRCQAMHLQQNGKYEQCDHRWTSKKCPNERCGDLNDIAARYCATCREEIVNPNDKLIAEFKSFKKDPTKIQCDKILSWRHSKTVSSSGKNVIKIDFKTEYRSFSVWYQVHGHTSFSIDRYNYLMTVTAGLEEMPRTVTYKKEPSGFYTVLKFNQKEDSINVN